MIAWRHWFLRVVLVFGLSWLLPALAFAHPLLPDLTDDELAWIAAHREKVFSVGYDPEGGKDVFEFQGRRQGALPDLLADMQRQLGLRFVLDHVSGWDDAYQRFASGQADILFGANPTPEREKIMRFTRPAWRYPYVVLARRDAVVQTLGDLDGRRVGFVANDFVAEQIPREYRNIQYQAVFYRDQDDALKALRDGKIDGMVTSGGGIEHDYLYRFPQLLIVATLSSITSDMTFAVHRNRDVLAALIDKYLVLRLADVQRITEAASRVYGRKIMHLTDAELAWLEQHGEATVGLADDYLPFDYYDEGEYRGIVGEVLKRIAGITGIRFKVISGPFAEIYEKARDGRIDVLNIAKTEERQMFFLYPRPISSERDIIIGRKDSPPVQDVYGLEGKRVAVIDGFWHEEYLRKNLKHSEMVRSSSIAESLRLVRQGKADYLIENPTVLEFYIHGLGYSDLVKRGNTSKDSFVYFGVNRKQPELAAIIDKALMLVDFEGAKFAGIQSAPALRNEEAYQLSKIIIGLLLVLAGVIFATVKVVQSLSEQKAQTQLLQEREHLLYTDTLTGFYSRNHFSHHADELNAGHYPQAVLMADLNNLKRVNDTLGHAAGDALIVAFALALREQFPSAKLFRMGGDEFLALVDGMSETQLVAAICQLQERCAKAIDGGGVPSAAIGYAIRYGDGEDLEVAIAAADERMYRAKAQIGGRRASDA